MCRERKQNPGTSCQVAKHSCLFDPLNLFNFSFDDQLILHITKNITLNFNAINVVYLNFEVLLLFIDIQVLYIYFFIE